MNYSAHSTLDRDYILETIGFSTVEELIDRIIPKRFQLDTALDLPGGASEYNVANDLKAFAAENTPASEGLCFLGGGSYDHYIPAAISHIIGRSEFATAYTPYQAEVSQGTLQTIYEFQTMICRLMGMDVANASHYDGASALAEGVLLACRRTRRNSVVLPTGLNPLYRQTLETYCSPVGIEIISVDETDGCIDIHDLENAAADAAAVVVQHPNFFGMLEPVEDITRIAHEAGALVVSSVYPVSLGLLKPPGEWGADIATGEGQALGVPMGMGGPYLGLFATRKQFVRMIPGRLIARAKDKHDRDGFVLTLQTREQHIRREKATSNICTNQALVALNALVYLSLVGAAGFRRVALNSYRGTHYLADKVRQLPGCRVRFTGEFFSEFVIELPDSADEVMKALADNGIFAGPSLGRWYPGMENCMLVAVTEKRTVQEIDQFVEVLVKIN